MRKALFLLSLFTFLSTVTSCRPEQANVILIVAEEGLVVSSCIAQPLCTPSRVKVHYDPRWSENVNQYRNTLVQSMGYKLYQDGSFFRLEDYILEQDPLYKEGLQSDDLDLYLRLHEVLFSIPKSSQNSQ